MNVFSDFLVNMINFRNKPEEVDYEVGLVHPFLLGL